jgi:glutamate/tyrosine decarboxylase-like PLP-dependent enzyme
VRTHDYDEETQELSDAIEAFVRQRIAEPQPLDGPLPADELDALAGTTITPEGIGGLEALRIWANVLAPATVSADQPSYLAFVPTAPTKASVLFDLVISASSTYGGNWLEGAGAVWAENQALGWLTDVVGFPAGSGGVFVTGGTAGNLSALVTARHTARQRMGGRPSRWQIACADTAHSSVASSARVIDADVIAVPHDERGRLTADALRVELALTDTEGLFAVVASAGSTNAGAVDDLVGIAEVCEERALWMHVDGAYGGAAMLAPALAPAFDGVQRADSFIVDPHKWLFAPFDSCALLYRDPALARAAHRQHASYLDATYSEEQWNPSDYAHHLTRRARGLPLWFSLAAYGTDAYREAVETVLRTTTSIADEIRSRPELDLVMEPQLSVLLFRRVGWADEDYDAWWRTLLEKGIAFVQPTSWEGEKVGRMCLVNPRTTLEHVRPVLDAMR